MVRQLRFTLLALHILLLLPVNSAAVGQVLELRLINAVTDLPIVNLTSGMNINLATLSTTKFNIEATTDTGIVGSIRFSYNGKQNFRTESDSPYAFCGDSTGNYKTCTNLVVGQHTVTATPYSGPSRTGTIGNARTVTFTITNMVVAPTQPIPAPIAPAVAPVTPIACNIPRFVTSTWQTFLPNYPVDTSEPMGLLIGNDMVAFSGFINTFTAVTNRTFARDMTIAGSPWRPMDDMPSSFAVTHSATALVGTKVFFCGGYIGAHPGPHTPLCYEYDHSKPPGNGQQWTRFVDLPMNGTAGAGMLYDTERRTLYYVGGGQRLKPGRPDATDLTNAWKYDFLQPSLGWVATTPVPYRANHLSTVTTKFLNKERHYIVGGQISEREVSGNLDDVFEFLASNETYVRRTSMPFARSHTTISTRAIGCGFFVAGGSANSITTKKNRTSNILYYDIPTNSWTSIGDIPLKVATPLVDIHPNGFMYFMEEKSSSRRQIAV